jgi:cysteine synthase
MEAIGNTPLLESPMVVPSVRTLVKVRGANPTGSTKDRLASPMIERPLAEDDDSSDGNLATLLADSVIKCLSTERFRASPN